MLDVTAADAAAAAPPPPMPDAQVPMYVPTPNISPVEPSHLKARHIPHKAIPAFGDVVAHQFLKMQDAHSRTQGQVREDVMNAEFDKILSLPGQTLSGATSYRVVRDRARALYRGTSIPPEELGYLRKDVDKFTADELQLHADRVEEKARARMQQQYEQKQRPLADCEDRIDRMSNRARMQLGRNSVQRAGKVITSGDIADAGDPLVVEALRARHPQAPPPTIPTLDGPERAPPQIDEETFRQIVHKLPRGTSSGPSGWTYEMIREVLLNHPDAFRGALWFVNQALPAELPRLRNLLACRLVALQKDEIWLPLALGEIPDVRPIAVPEAWARLLSLCALAVEKGIGATLLPNQAAVSVPGGAAILGHAVRQGSLHPDTVTITLDIANAFNTLDRTAMLEAVATRGPSLLPFATYMYAQPSTLYISGAHEGTEPILSSQGVRQGDPCAPLFFALGIQDDLQRASAAGNQGAPALAYADDVTVQGSADAAVTTVNALTARLGRKGLHVNASKCKVWSSNPELAAEVATRLRFGANCVAQEGLVIAGTPIGTPTFIAKHARKRVDDTSKAILDLLALSLNAQEKFVILHQCLQHRETHMLRTSEWPHLQPELSRLENTIIKAVRTIARIGSAEFQVHHRDQMQLPLRLGGMGIVKFEESRANAAFLAGAALAQSALAQAPTRFQPLHPTNAAALWTKFAALIAQYPEICRDAAAPREQLILQTLPRLQTAVNKAAAQRQYARLLDSFSQDALDLPLPSEREQALEECARLRTYACRESTIWLTVVPSYCRLRLDTVEWQVGVRAQLGLASLPAYDANDEPPRCFCSQQVSSTPCRHAQSCSVLGKVIGGRHSTFLTTWREICGCAGLTTSWEPHVDDYLVDTMDATNTPGPSTQQHDGTPGAATTSPQNAADAPASALTPAPARPQTQTRAPYRTSRGDFMVAFPGQPPVMADVGVTSAYRGGILRAAAAQTGAAAKDYEDAKHAKYRQAGASYCEHVPVIHETSGRLSTSGWKLFKRIADVAAAGGAVTRSEFISAHLGRLGIVNTRAIFRLLLAYTSVHARLSGSALVAGAQSPTTDVRALTA